MAAENTIRCRPPATSFWQWFFVILGAMTVFGALIFAGLFMIMELLSDYATDGQTKWVLLVLSCAMSLFLLFLFIHWEQDRWYWTLTGEALIGGRNQTQRYPLSSIESVVPGLPEKTNILVEVNNVINPGLWQAVMQERRLALLLKFADGSFMPLHVHRCVDGRTLMSELIRRLADRLDPKYVYTEREVKALRSADWNRVVTRDRG